MHKTTPLLVCVIALALILLRDSAMLCTSPEHSVTVVYRCVHTRGREGMDRCDAYIESPVNCVLTGEEGTILSEYPVTILCDQGFAFYSTTHAVVPKGGRGCRVIPDTPTCLMVEPRHSLFHCYSELTGDLVGK